jgi:hypothetical protein
MIVLFMVQFFVIMDLCHVYYKIVYQIRYSSHLISLGLN